MVARFIASETMRRYSVEPCSSAAEIEVLEDVQHLDQHHAAARRLVGRDAVAAIVAP